jgi:hypothetical protein
MSGYPHLKHILRISLPARAVNRGPVLFGANHGLCGSYPGKPNRTITSGLPTTREQSPLERLSVPSKVQVVTSQRSDRTHAAAKQPVPMAMPMAGTRNQ